MYTLYMHKIVLLKRLYHALRGYETKLLINSKAQCTVLTLLSQTQYPHNVWPVKLNSEI